MKISVPTGMVLGTAQLTRQYGVLSSGDYSVRRSRRTAFEILETAQLRGVGVLDTAPSYGDAETIIGESSWSGSIWTKLDPALEPRDSLDRSLSALGRDAIDTIFVHDPQSFLSLPPRRLEAIRMLRGQGAHRLGISAYEAEEVLRAVQLIDFDVIQFPVNLFDTRVISELRNGRFPSSGGYVGRSVFLQGLLAQPQSAIARVPSPLREPLRKWAGQCSALGVDAGEAALAWALSLDVLSAVIVGSETASQLRQILDWAASPRIPEILETVKPENLWPDSDPRRWTV